MVTPEGRRRVVILQGHPDPRGGHLCHALAQAYAEGCHEAGHIVSDIDVAHLDFPLLRTKEEFERGDVPECLKSAQSDIKQADHLLIVYPLWLGSMPALLKGFLEQIIRPGFAYSLDKGMGRKLLKGKSARIVVTMGMPVFFYRWYFGAHGLKSLERSILGFIGISPIRESLFGMVENVRPARREKWIARMKALGKEAR